MNTRRLFSCLLLALASVALVPILSSCTIIRYNKIALDSRKVAVQQKFELPVDEGIVYETFDKLMTILGEDTDQIAVMYLAPERGVPNTWLVIYEGGLAATPHLMRVRFERRSAGGVITPIR